MTQGRAARWHKASACLGLQHAGADEPEARRRAHDDRVPAGVRELGRDNRAARDELGLDRAAVEPDADQGRRGRLQLELGPAGAVEPERALVEGQLAVLPRVAEERLAPGRRAYVPGSGAAAPSRSHRSTGGLPPASPRPFRRRPSHPNQAPGVADWS